MVGRGGFVIKSPMTMRKRGPFLKKTSTFMLGNYLSSITKKGLLSVSSYLIGRNMVLFFEKLLYQDKLREGGD